MPIDIAVDFGTSKTILLQGSKVVLEQPSVATVDTETWEPVCFGERAYKMIGRTPESLTTVFPMTRGTISDYKTAELMLKYYMKEAFGHRVFKPRIMVSVPIAVTTLQHRSVANVARDAGGRSVCTIEAPVAAALGLGIDFTKPNGALIIDIGAGTTDIAAVSMGGLAKSASLGVASMDFDAAIIRFVKRKYNIMIGDLTAESIKKQIGCVVKRQIPLTMNVGGMDMVSGLPVNFEITSDDVFEATKEVANSICTGIKKVISETDPDLLADIMEKNAYLCGGGCQIYGMRELVSEFTGMKIKQCEDPAHIVVKGARTALKNPELLKDGDYRFRSIEDLITD